MILADRLWAHHAQVTLIGQGYVGLPVAVAFGHAGFRVTGVDTDPDRIAALRAGRSNIEELMPTGAESGTSGNPTPWRSSRGYSARARRSPLQIPTRPASIWMKWS